MKRTTLIILVILLALPVLAGPAAAQTEEPDLSHCDAALLRTYLLDVWGLENEFWAGLNEGYVSERDRLYRQYELFYMIATLPVPPCAEQFARVTYEYYTLEALYATTESDVMRRQIGKEIDAYIDEVYGPVFWPLRDYAGITPDDLDNAEFGVNGDYDLPGRTVDSNRLPDGGAA